MIDTPFSVLKPMAAAALLVAGFAAAHAQEPSPQRDTGFFGQIFGPSERLRPSEAPAQMAQMSPSEMVVRMDRLENQIRQLTGLVEQLQFRNQQLEQQLRQVQGAAFPQARPQSIQPAQTAPPPGPPAQPPRRSDAADPNQNPDRQSTRLNSSHTQISHAA